MRSIADAAVVDKLDIRQAVDDFVGRSFLKSRHQSWWQRCTAAIVSRLPSQRHRDHGEDRHMTLCTPCHRQRNSCPSVRREFVRSANPVG